MMATMTLLAMSPTAEANNRLDDLVLDEVLDIGVGGTEKDCVATAWGTVCASIWTSTGYAPNSRCGGSVPPSTPYCLRQTSTGSARADLQGVTGKLVATHANGNCSSMGIGLSGFCAVNNAESYSWHASLSDCMWARMTASGTLAGDVTARTTAGICP